MFFPIPINENGSIITRGLREEEIVEKRKNFDLAQLNRDISIIEKILNSFNINKTNINIIVNDLLFIMVHPNPEKRINSVDILLDIVNRIQKKTNIVHNT